MPRLRNPAARQKLQDKDDQSHDEQQVDESAEDVEAESERPKDKKNDEDGPEHDVGTV